MRARLVAYAGTQLGDFFRGRALALVVVTALAGWGYFRASGLTPRVFDPTGGVEARDAVRGLYETLLVIFAFAGALFAARGLVARDRWRGSYRVLFARPMSPVRYYGQAFLVTGLGTVLLAAVIAELFAVLVLPVSVVGTVAFVATAWLLIGGLGFALSSAMRSGWLVLLLLVAIDLVLGRYVSPGQPGAALASVARVVQYALPPAHVLVGLRAPFARGVLVSPAMLVWPIAFGATSVAVALLVLRRRPFDP